MCLDVIDGTYTGKSRTVRECYKILKDTDSFMHANRNIEKGVWMESGYDYSTNLGSISNTYAPGFHVFRNKISAKRYAKRQYSFYKIVKVQVKGCLARGWQDDVVVEVYKYIKFTRVR